ncbi:MAG TPA: hypothetical protein VK086_03830 [Ruania sp.]|nr:hypothetical protein [Ruania sp.]
MAIDPRRLLAELPLPLRRDAGELEAIGIAIAVEDAFAVTLAEETLTVAHLGTSEAIEHLLDEHGFDVRDPEEHSSDEHSRDVDELGVDEHGTGS